eukprot:455607_1
MSSKIRPKKNRFQIGGLCKVFNTKKQKWIKGSIINMFDDDQGTWICVTFKDRKICLEVLETSPKIRSYNKKHKNTSDALDPAKLYQNYFKLNWQHIANAISHELYNKIAKSFMVIINSDKKMYKTINAHNINNLLDKLKTKNRISNDEINYIKQLIRRAVRFQPFANKANVYESKVNDISIDVYEGLNIDMLYDIYSVHNCFLFTNYHFKPYPKHIFINSVDANEHCKQYKNRIKSKHIPSIDLYPQYIIDDNMYDILRYFFAASHVVNNFVEGNFRVKIVVIPNRVVSVYDENILFSYNITDIYQYFMIKRCQFRNATMLSTLEFKNISNIINTFEYELRALAADQQVTISNNLIFVIDRRETVKRNIDFIYVASTTTD